MRITSYHKETFISNIIRDIPQTDFIEQARSLVIKAANEELPDKLKELYKEEKFRSFFSRKNIYHVQDGINLNVMVDNNHYVLSGEALESVRSLLKKQGTQNASIYALSNRLRAEMTHVHTDTKLNEMYPDLVKYMPKVKEAATKDVPAASTVVDSLRDLGFPKSQT